MKKTHKTRRYRRPSHDQRVESGKSPVCGGRKGEDVSKKMGLVVRTPEGSSM